MCRMRTIAETAKFFREMDENTQITESTLRKMISEGTIPAIKTGTKHLINLDTVLQLFNAPAKGFEKVRPVDAFVIEK